MKKRNLLLLFFVILFLSCNEKIKIELINKNFVGQYIDNFNKNDVELYQQYINNADAKKFLLDNVPLIEIPDKDIEETYYFRWWTY